MLAAAAVALLGAALRGLAAAGPVSAQPAALTWIFAGPVDRAGLLAPRFWLSAAGATALGAAVGALLPVPTDAGASATVLAGTAAGAFLGLATASAPPPPSSTRRRRSARPVGGAWLGPAAVGSGLVGLGAVGGLAAAVLGLAGHPLPAPPTVPVLVTAAALAAALAAVAGRRARSGLGRSTAAPSPPAAHSCSA